MASKNQAGWAKTGNGDYTNLYLDCLLSVGLEDEGWEWECYRHKKLVASGTETSLKDAKAAAEDAADDQHQDLGDAGPVKPRGIAAQWPHKNFSKLFTSQSVKILKSNDRFPDWLSAVLYLAPGTAADWWLRKEGQLGPGEVFVGDLCPRKTSMPPATPGGLWGGCFGEYGENCIFTTGQLALPVGKLAMIHRTLFMKRYPDEFMALLYHELRLLKNYAAKHGRKLAVRLNGTSDIRWEKTNPEIFADHPDIRFYDYTKIWERFLPKHGVPPPKLPKNYSLTFSSSEVNDVEVEAVLKAGGNVAMVFDIPPTMSKYHMRPMVTKAYGYRVIDGDLHDLRFKDPKGVIVGLRAKGALRKEVKTGESQFVRYITDTPEYAAGTVKFHPDDPRYEYGPNPFINEEGRLKSTREAGVDKEGRPRFRFEGLGALENDGSFVRVIGSVKAKDVPDAIEEVTEADAPALGGSGAAPQKTIPMYCEACDHTWFARAYVGDDGGIYFEDEEHGDVCELCGEKGEFK